MHDIAIAIAILKYGYLDDNTALRRYSASCGPDHDSRMSKKKKVVLAARLDSLSQQTCMALFLNIFIVTSNSSSLAWPDPWIGPHFGAR